MKYRDIKLLIGAKAKEIIISDMGIKSKGNFYSCAATKHKNDNMSAKWFDNSYKFYCYDCGKSFDIIDMAETRANKYEWLHDIAGIKIETQNFKPLKPITKKITDKAIKFFENRGISKDTIETYSVRSDDKYIYFNYATPDKNLVKIKKREIENKAYLAVSGGKEIFYGMHLLKNQKTLAICEGETDALALYEITKIIGKQNEILCTSVPNGASSLNEILLDRCRQWIEQFENIVVIPDNDNPGKKLKESALNLLSDYNLEIICFPDDINDVNEYLQSPDHNPSEIFKYSKRLIPELDGVKQSSEIGTTEIKNGLRTGYVTHDYNDNGLKDGGLTIVTGATGMGKTTYVRQIVISLAKQRISSGIFVGETTIKKEKSKFAKLCAEKGEIVAHQGIAFNSVYIPSIQAIERYNKTLAKFIYMTDIVTLNAGDNIISKLLREMNKMVKFYSCKVFVIDNLMVVCQKDGPALFSEQKNIALKLKSFAENTNSHVILIAHPKKGCTDEQISGATETQNLSDTIIRYVRINDETKASLIKKMPDKADIIARCSARIKWEKVRDDGHKKTIWLEFDPIKGAVYDVSDLKASTWYEEKNFWTRSILQKSNSFKYQ